MYLRPVGLGKCPTPWTEGVSMAWDHRLETQWSCGPPWPGAEAVPPTVGIRRAGRRRLQPSMAHAPKISIYIIYIFIHINI